MRTGQPFLERVTASGLDGGGRLAVLANPHAPTVTIVGTLRAGPALAADGRFSVPGLTAAMLERGTAEHGRMELARELEERGPVFLLRGDRLFRVLRLVAGPPAKACLERLRSRVEHGDPRPLARTVLFALAAP